MGFEFRPRKGVEICGRAYDVDVTDVGFIEAVITDFSAIMAKYAAFAGLQERLAREGAGPEAVAGAVEELSKENAEIIAHARAFVVKALGEGAYAEIFDGRRPNSVDHVELVTYIYGEVMKGREGVAAQYLDPPKNRGERRAAAAAAKRAGGRGKAVPG